jgi:hypothetical protein
VEACRGGFTNRAVYSCAVNLLNLFQASKLRDSVVQRENIRHQNMAIIDKSAWRMTTKWDADSLRGNPLQGLGHEKIHGGSRSQ